MVGLQSVTVKMDLTREQMIQALKDFAPIADSANWAVVYYSGHGVEFVRLTLDDGRLSLGGHDAFHQSAGLCVMFNRLLGTVAWR